MSYRLTLAETEAYLRKAARASGLDWGLAEEAGKTARWLAAFNLPGPEIMLQHLEGLKDKDYKSFVPDCNFTPWQAAGGLLCPIITGAAIADRSASMAVRQPTKLGLCAYPLLLAAPLGQAARHHESAFIVCWDGARIDCFGDGISIEGERDALLLAEVGGICCCREEKMEPQQLAATGAYEIDEAVFKRIDALAFQTYVAATEESRAGAGAGAGLTDND